MRIRRSAVLIVVLLILTVGCATMRAPIDPLRITHGIASGDVTSSSAVIWARASRAATMTVEYMTIEPLQRPALHSRGVPVAATQDFIGHGVLEGLRADTRYAYRVRFVDGQGGTVVSEAGHFRTAPADGATRALTLVWWGDLGG